MALKGRSFLTLKDFTPEEITRLTKLIMFPDEGLFEYDNNYAERVAKGLIGLVEEENPEEVLKQKEIQSLINNIKEANKDLDKYKLEQEYRFPVTLVPSYDLFNAYFSTYGYNRIVMFDTRCNDEMLVYKDDFLKVFYHELTHAINLNIRNKFWYGFRN